ncbi:MAG: metallophosphoesterase [Ruminococcus sp.]|uniref:metallophosphoesterase n=1 Tax=Ruminococcus sp. TaxID=41978 RepID=UPI001B180749|nr:metallophosphoesterase [Ruminococcus sp.]MBO7472467.1 metallophosphoesterase [Ruminococcus sp.]
MFPLLLAAVSSILTLVLDDNYVYSAAEDFTEILPYTSENGIITLDDGQQWFKATELENDRNYLITVRRSDGSDVMLTADDKISAEYIWHYAEDKMVTSTSFHRSELYTDTHRLCCYDSDLYLTKNWWTSGDQTWNYDGSRLYYNDDGKITYLTYSEMDDIHFGCTDDPSMAAQISLYTAGEELARCIKTQPCAESFVIEGSGYQAPVFSLELINDSIVTDSVKWFVDGVEQTGGELSFTADELTDQSASIHRVSCIVEAHDGEEHHYRERSQDAIFVITKGIVPDSFITFSDVHEQYDLIGKAIEGVLERTGGYIPSLVVCTGDLINGPTMDHDTMLDRYIPRLKPYLGGLDTVFVAGNHDSSKAISELSIAAGLGADDGFSDGCGVIFRGSSDEVAENGTNCTAAKNIIVYGINYDTINKRSGALTVQDYDCIKDQIESFLNETAKNYHGELIVFSAHAGLHVLGVQPQSVNLSGYTVGSWIGANAYNIDHSYDIAELINSYADKYGMNIIYLFGHDHSRSEEEFILTEGDVLISPTKSEYKETESLPLNFTYAHAGYLSTTIGIADAHYSFIYKSGDKLVYEFLRADTPDFMKKKEIKLKKSTTAVVSTNTAAVTTIKKSSSPQTSDKLSLMPVLLFSAGLFWISRKQKNK